MVQIVALNNVPQGYNYGQEVRFEVHDQHKMDYREAADFLNLSQTEVICLQHEFGIFGGDDGAYILSMLGNLKKPVVTTLHTVIKEPTKGQLETLRSVCLYSTLNRVRGRIGTQKLWGIESVKGGKGCGKCRILYDEFEFNPGKNRKFIDLSLPLLYHGEEKYEWFVKWQLSNGISGKIHQNTHNA